MASSCRPHPSAPQHRVILRTRAFGARERISVQGVSGAKDLLLGQLQSARIHGCAILGGCLHKGGKAKFAFQESKKR